MINRIHGRRPGRAEHGRGPHRVGDARSHQPDDAGQPPLMRCCASRSRARWPVSCAGTSTRPGSSAAPPECSRGYTLAVLAILGSAKVAVALLVLGVPIIDTFWIIVGRLTQRRSPFTPDRSHIHHRCWISAVTPDTVLFSTPSAPRSASSPCSSRKDPGVRIHQPVHDRRPGPVGPTRGAFDRPQNSKQSHTSRTTSPSEPQTSRATEQCADEAGLRQHPSSTGSARERAGASIGRRATICPSCCSSRSWRSRRLDVRSAPPAHADMQAGRHRVAQADHQGPLARCSRSWPVGRSYAIGRASVSRR